MPDFPRLQPSPAVARAVTATVADVPDRELGVCRSVPSAVALSQTSHPTRQQRADELRRRREETGTAYSRSEPRNVSWAGGPIWKGRDVARSTLPSGSVPTPLLLRTQVPSRLGRHHGQFSSDGHEEGHGNRDEGSGSDPTRPWRWHLEAKPQQEQCGDAPSREDGTGARHRFCSRVCGFTPPALEQAVPSPKLTRIPPGRCYPSGLSTSSSRRRASSRLVASLPGKASAARNSTRASSILPARARSSARAAVSGR